MARIDTVKTSVFSSCSRRLEYPEYQAISSYSMVFSCYSEAQPSRVSPAGICGLPSADKYAAVFVDVYLPS